MRLMRLAGGSQLLLMRKHTLVTVAIAIKFTNWCLNMGISALSSSNFFMFASPKIAEEMTIFYIVRRVVLRNVTLSSFIFRDVFMFSSISLLLFLCLLSISSHVISSKSICFVVYCTLNEVFQSIIFFCINNLNLWFFGVNFVFVQLNSGQNSSRIKLEENG